jgi:hypothetical protein
VIADVVADFGPPRLRRPQGPPFAALARAIVHQQLAGAAASAIHGRLVAAMDGDVRPGALLALSDETLRAVGLSANKVASLRDLATKVLDGTVVLSPRGLSRQSDEEIVARLSAVRGIGPWTAEMFLMSEQGRCRARFRSVPRIRTAGDRSEPPGRATNFPRTSPVSSGAGLERERPRGVRAGAFREAHFPQPA